MNTSVHTRQSIPPESNNGWSAKLKHQLKRLFEFEAPVEAPTEDRFYPTEPQSNDQD
jgi:hypothetical protein